MRTIFVTGGAGYVGSHACKAFAAAGWRVVVYDNLSRGHAEAVRWGELIVGDILDRERLEEALHKVQPDCVAHFAAFAYVGESVADPGMYYRNNTVGSATLLEAMRACGVSRILFSSTCATYGDPETPVIDEQHPQRPVNPYGWSKLFVERMLDDYHKAYGMQSVSLRYFNASGADPEMEIGEEHDPETHVIPLALRAALGEIGSFELNGVDFDTVDGSAVRDFIHVADLASAHVLAADALMRSIGRRVYNLGTGIGTSILELVQAVRDVTGRPLEPVIAPRRPGDPAALVASARRVREELGWQPRYSDMKTILQTALQWENLRHAKVEGGHAVLS